MLVRVYNKVILLGILFLKCHNDYTCLPNLCYYDGTTINRHHSNNHLITIDDTNSNKIPFTTSLKIKIKYFL